MNNKGRYYKKSLNRIFIKYTINITLLLLSILFIFFIGEFSLRVYHLFKYDKPVFSNKSGQQSITVDDKLGWRPTENYLFQGKKKDASGKIYDVHITTDIYGFRAFGNPESSKTKLLVIGDSFTQALEVSDNKTYYGIIASKLLDKIEVFVWPKGLLIHRMISKNSRYATDLTAMS